MTTQEYSVEVKDDFIERQAKAQPIQALSELVWNSLDADATEVSVELEYDALGGLSKIYVRDNGHGLPRDEAPDLFRSLGGSWKRTAMQTKKLKRMLHGQEGRGRFKAFAVAQTVDWTVVYHKAGTPKRFEITILEREISRVRISDEADMPGGKSGVIVTLSELKRQFTSLKPENAIQDLAEVFAIYLKDYRDVAIEYCGEKIDPALAIREQWTFELARIIHDPLRLVDFPPPFSAEANS
jgi:HSP90 family molecular chaperone